MYCLFLVMFWKKRRRKCCWRWPVSWDRSLALCHERPYCKGIITTLYVNLKEQVNAKQQYYYFYYYYYYFMLAGANESSKMCNMFAKRVILILNP